MWDLGLPNQGFEPVSSAVEVRSLHHWAWEVPRTLLNSSPHPTGLLPSSDPQTGLPLGSLTPIAVLATATWLHFQ